MSIPTTRHWLFLGQRATGKSTAWYRWFLEHGNEPYSAVFVVCPAGFRDASHQALQRWADTHHARFYYAKGLTPDIRSAIAAAERPLVVYDGLEDRAGSPWHRLVEECGQGTARLTCVTIAADGVVPLFRAAPLTTSLCVFAGLPRELRAMVKEPTRAHEWMATHPFHFLWIDEKEGVVRLVTDKGQVLAWPSLEPCGRLRETRLEGKTPVLPAT